MPPRGSRLACTLKTTDGAHGSFDAFPGEQPGSVSKVEPVRWNKPGDAPVAEAMFSLIGEMGMTGQVILVKQSQWRALTEARLEQFFYGAILWGKSPFKVIEDAERILKREK